MNLVLLTHKGIIAGKLNGVIPAVTPSGKRKVRVSMSFEIFCSASPRWREGILQQCSTTSEISYEHQNHINVKNWLTIRSAAHYFHKVS